MDGEEFAALQTDIAAHGVREPVVLFEGQILDGRNRYRASKACGVDCPLTIYDGDDPVAFVISLNLRRRPLDKSQRAMVHARIATLPKGVRADSQIWLSVPTQAEAAKLLNIGVSSGKYARRVLDDGAPELVCAVEHGQVSVSAAADVASLPME